MNDTTVSLENRLYRWNWQAVVVPGLVLAAGVMLIPWGAESFGFVHHWLRKLPLSSYFSTVVQVGSFSSVAGMGILIYLLDRKRAVYLPYLLCALMLAGSVNNVVKQLAGRSRPSWSVSMSRSNRAELQEFAAAHPEYRISVKKEDQWLGPRADRPYFMDRYASFPSGHACGSLVIAAFLSLMYPAARRFWIIVAVSCALARVYGERHYLEDIMVGGALGWIVALWTFTWRWPLLVGKMVFSETYRSRRVNKRQINPATEHQPC